MEEKIPKIHFLLGLFVGIAVVSTVAFFTLLVIKGDKSELESATNKTVNKNINKEADINFQDSQDNPVVPANKLPQITGDDHIRGNFEAPVTLIEFSDFECPYCARFHVTLKDLLAEYGGRVRLVFKHYPLPFHKNAQKAAEASECAGEQSKFWEMHDLIFEAQANQTMSVEKWQEEAEKLGLNTTQFKECLDSGKYVDKIKADTILGNSLGVKGTPATFVGDELIGGAVPYESLKAIVESKLKEIGK